MPIRFAGRSRVGALARLCLALSILGTCAATADAHGMGRSASAPVTRPGLDPARSTLWLIGDSTVRNGQDRGDNGQWGWGSVVGRYVDTSRINVRNRALGGTSSRSFRNNRRWEQILSEMRPGDYLVMQFGHNDAGPLDDPARARGTLRGNGEETRAIENPITKQPELVHTYGWYLRQYVAEAKAKGVKACIICSPIPRNAWTAGKVVRNTGYGPAAAEAARQAGAAFVDLNEIAARRYEAEGQEKVAREYFTPTDGTHTSWSGAVVNAECFVEGLRGLGQTDLVGYLLPNPPATRPA